MKLIGKTIVITGGTSGIGYELVKSLSNDNLVLVVARKTVRLDRLFQEFPKIKVFPADLSIPGEVESISDQIIRSHNSIDLLINNAAVQNTPTFLDDDFNFDAIGREVQLNFTAICELSYLLLPALLNNHGEVMIANINSGLGLAPKTNSAVYCATKAAMDSFSQCLSYQLEHTNVKVTQAFLPLVETPMTEGRGAGKLSAKFASDEIIAGIEEGRESKNIGKVKLLRLLLRLAPSIARKIMKGA